MSFRSDLALAQEAIDEAFTLDGLWTLTPMRTADFDVNSDVEADPSRAVSTFRAVPSLVVSGIGSPVTNGDQTGLPIRQPAEHLNRMETISVALASLSIEVRAGDRVTSPDGVEYAVRSVAADAARHRIVLTRVL